MTMGEEYAFNFIKRTTNQSSTINTSLKLSKQVSTKLNHQKTGSKVFDLTGRSEKTQRSGIQSTKNVSTPSNR